MSKTLTAEQFRVKDLSLAEYGRHQIRLAEAEMPGLMAMREEFGPRLHGGKELERKFRVNQTPRVRIKRDQNRGPTHFLGRGH